MVEYPHFSELAMINNNVIGKVSKGYSIETPPNIEEYKTRKQIAIKQQCASYILTKYSEPIQRSASLGIYAPEIVIAMATFIAGCIAEENRCYDAIEIAITIADIDVINPTFPA